MLFQRTVSHRTTSYSYSSAACGGNLYSSSSSTYFCINTHRSSSFLRLASRYLPRWINIYPIPSSISNRSAAGWLVIRQRWRYNKHSLRCSNCVLGWPKSGLCLEFYQQYWTELFILNLISPFSLLLFHSTTITLLSLRFIHRKTQQRHTFNITRPQ